MYAALGFVLLFFLILLTGFAGNRKPLLWPVPAVATLAAAHFLTPGGLALHLSTGWGWRLGAGFLTGLLLQSAYFMVMLRTGAVTLGQRQTGAYLLRHIWRILATSAYIGFAEEALFRGYLFAVLPEGWPVWVTIGVTALLFTVSHLMSNLGTPLPRWVQLLTYGLLFGALYAQTRSLWFIGGLHWGVDFGSFFYFGGKGKVPGGPFTFLDTNLVPEREPLRLWSGAALVGLLSLLLAPVWL